LLFPPSPGIFLSPDVPKREKFALPAPGPARGYAEFAGNPGKYCIVKEAGMADAQSPQDQSAHGQTVIREYTKPDKLPRRFIELPATERDLLLVCIRSNRLLMPKQVAAELNLQKAKFATMGYDPAYSEIGIVFYNDDPIREGIKAIKLKEIIIAPGAKYRVHDKARYAFFIDIGRFAEGHNITLPRRGTYYRLGFEDGCYTVDLSSPIRLPEQRHKETVETLAEKLAGVMRELEEKVKLREDLLMNREKEGTYELILVRERIKKLHRLSHSIRKRKHVLETLPD
jgi:hypothetical protein